MKTIKITQHNIGCTSHVFGDEVIHENYFKGKNYPQVVQKKINTPRSCKNYFKHNNIFKSDIWTLQEVQEIPASLFIDKLYTIYKWIGTNTGYCIYDNFGKIVKISHGCAVIWNSNRFNFCKLIPHHLKSELFRRATPWVLLEDKLTLKRSVVISLHSRIKYSTRLLYELNNGVKMFEKYYSIFVGGDFNVINVHKKTKILKSTFENEITNKHTYMNKNKIEYFEGNIDNILFSKNFKIAQKQIEKHKMFSLKTLCKFEKENELINDFDHAPISVSLS